MGGVRNIEDMDKILNETDIQYFSMARPFICEPDLINKWANNETNKAKCVSCNGCMKDLNNFHCILNK